MILVTWIQALLYASFPALGWSYYEYHPGTLHCSPAWTSDCSLYIFLLLAGFVIPLLIMVVTYIRIFHVIRKHSRKIRNLKFNVDSASFQVNALFSATREQDSPSPEIQNFSMDYPTAINGIALHNSSNECALSPTAIVTQEDGNVSRFLTQDDFLSPDHSQLPLPLEVPRESLTTCDLFEEAKPSLVLSELTPSVTTIQKLRVKRCNLRGMFQRVRSNLHSRRRVERQLPKEYKIAKTGLLLFVLFLILWLPYLVVNSCSTKEQAPGSVFHIAMWMVYMNGVANPIAYAFNNRNVKTKFRQIFHKMFGIFSRCREKI
jgi:hypothetical protein